MAFYNKIHTEDEEDIIDDDNVIFEGKKRRSLRRSGFQTKTPSTPLGLFKQTSNGSLLYTKKKLNLDIVRSIRK